MKQRSPNKKPQTPGRIQVTLKSHPQGFSNPPPLLAHFFSNLGGFLGLDFGFLWGEVSIFMNFRSPSPSWKRFCVTESEVVGFLDVFGGFSLVTVTGAGGHTQMIHLFIVFATCGSRDSFRCFGPGAVLCT